MFQVAARSERRRRAIIAAGALLGVVLSMNGVLVGQSLAAGDEVERRGQVCGRPAAAVTPTLGLAEAAAAAADPMYIPSHARWLATPAVDEALIDLGELIETGAAGPVIGWFPDWRERTIVVVREPGGLTDEETARRSSAVIGGRVRIALATSCVTRQLASEILKDVRRLTSTTNSAAGLIPESGKVEIALPPGSSAAAAELEQKYGAAVDVRFTDVQAAGRYDDGSPHYGGAAVRNQYLCCCTSGFVVENSTGRWGTTAGHCDDDGLLNYASGSTTINYGTSGVDAFSRGTDIVRIGSSVERYNNQIHTEPGLPLVRRVTGKVRGLSENFCLSGQVTRAICGIRFVADNIQVCYNNRSGRGGCFFAIQVRSTTPGTIVVRAGDSGGPAYGRHGTDEASARGIIIARADGDTTGYLEQIGDVEDALGSSIALTNNPRTSF